MQKMIDTLKIEIANIEYALKISEGTITGTPWIVQLSEGLYLVAAGEEGYRAGSVAGCVVYYSPEKIDGAVAHILQEHGSVFPRARKVNRRDALRSELEANKRRLAQMQTFVEQVAA